MLNKKNKASDVVVCYNYKDVLIYTEKRDGNYTIEYLVGSEKYLDLVNKINDVFSEKQSHEWVRGFIIGMFNKDYLLKDEK